MTSSPYHIRGFTLVELMVVIVIMGIMASLVLINTGGVEQRKAMQAREVLLLDLQRILREANDQSRILALTIQPATDVTPFRYAVTEYRPQTQSAINEQKWQNYAEFKLRNLPEQVSFQVQSLEQRYTNAQNPDLTQADTPKLIWLGNGEVKPVRIQFFLENREVGHPIEIDHLGKINAG
ncbi:type II secretion system GspH family protein [Acinetobacter bohemicus]|uniref:pilus assembly FimT family protein n=1 Tax=Acinetobacter sp. S4397-1 TaxID=2972915 RepID=UPI00209AA9D1|nr:type II secretion system protein [Acinetobacter sp. S4397-1]MCO8045496.1 type II secretion system GspH family protein [Acinetobacter sp. S4397-1]